MKDRALLTCFSLWMALFVEPGVGAEPVPISARGSRPASATVDMKRLYEDLVDMKLGGAPRKEALPFDGDARLTIHRDVVYGKTHPEVQKLDAYLVKSGQPTPVLIEFHGGGWRRGSKSQFIYQGDFIRKVLDAGISVVAVVCRIGPQVGKDQAADNAAILDFLRRHLSNQENRP